MRLAEVLKFVLPRWKRLLIGISSEIVSNKANNFWEKNIETKMIPKDEVNFDVIIVGGGPAGSAAACYAAKKDSKFYY